MTLTDVGTRYNGMELSPERVAAFFLKKAPPPCPSPRGRGVNSEIPHTLGCLFPIMLAKIYGYLGIYSPLHYFPSVSNRWFGEGSEQRVIPIY